MENKIDSRPAPQFAVGDWAYNNHKGHNARIVSVVWEPHMNRWYYWMPGLGGPWPYAETKDAPYVEYEQVGRAWQEVKHG